MNLIHNRDILEVLSETKDNSIDMIWGDPDYNVGINYAGKNYTTKWNDYIDWYIQLTQECMRVLKPTGNLFMMNYPKQNAHLRVKYLDEAAYDVQDYVWIYNSNFGLSKRRFTKAHRSILHATKTKENNFYKNQVQLPYKNPESKTIQKRILEGHGRMPYSWFYYNLVKNYSADKTIHPCQIPIDLFDMFMNSSTQKGDDVFILFGGSGREIVHCMNSNRNYLSCEIHPLYYEMIHDQLNNGGLIDDKYRLDYVIRNGKKFKTSKPIIQQSDFF